MYANHINFILIKSYYASTFSFYSSQTTIRILVISEENSFSNEICKIFYLVSYIVIRILISWSLKGIDNLDAVTREWNLTLIKIIFIWMLFINECYYMEYNNILWKTKTQFKFFLIPSLNFYASFSQRPLRFFKKC